MIAPDDALRQLALRHGFEPRWQDFRGRPQEVGLDTLRRLLRAQGVEPGDPVAALAEATNAAQRAVLPPRLTGTVGEALYIPVPASGAEAIPWQMQLADGSRHEGRAVPRQHEAPGSDSAGPLAAVELRLPDRAGEAVLHLGGPAESEVAVTIAPAKCFQGPLAEGRLWGLGVQVYGLRTEGCGGLGHLGALPRLTRAAAARGADALALSPTHALFSADPSHFSPYAPSSRARINGWLADPGGMPDLATQAALAAGLGLDADLVAAEALDLIDYRAAVPLRLALLRALFARFEAAHLANPTALGQRFLDFRGAGGVPLEDHARFEALHAHHLAHDPQAWDWRGWAAPLRDARGPAVAAFAAAHADTVTFHVFLQWLGEEQLAAAQRAATEAGMSIGLISDFAVGTHRGGSRAWSGSAALLDGVSIGAPPDLLNGQGQDWGLTTFAPTRLVAQGYEPFLEDLRAATAHVGGVRIDHVMGLARIWCVPEGASAAEGAYMRFPAADLMRLLAAESHRSRSVTIGEDLGTLPEGYHGLLERTGLYGMRVLFFERDAQGGFSPPQNYSRHALAMSTTHDLATFVGWWKGGDITLRGGLGMLAAGRDVAAEMADRDSERAALWQALRQHGGAEGDCPAEPTAAVGVAMARFLGGTPSALVMLPLEDAVLAEPQVNLPGTTDAHPNWRRRLSKPAEELLDEPPATDILAALDARRREGSAA